MLYIKDVRLQVQPQDMRSDIFDELRDKYSEGREEKAWNVGVWLLAFTAGLGMIISLVNYLY